MILTKEQRIAKHKDFLSANWVLIAAFGWEQYLAKGRGAVFVMEEDFIYAKHPIFTTIRLWFITDGSPELKKLGGWPGDKEAGWIRDYDPETRVVVLVVRDNSGTSGYLAGGPTPPPLAFAARQTKAN